MSTNDSQKSYRKPHVAKIEGNWWLKSRYYLFYIIRESTAFAMIWLSMVLMFGVICAKTNDLGQDEFYRFIFFLQNPFVIALNVLALMATLFHSITWFNLAPKAINVVIAGKQPPTWFFIIALWSITIIVSIIMLLLVLGYFR